MAKPSQREIDAALARGGINIPYHSVTKRRDGALVFITRYGKMVVTPASAGEAGSVTTPKTAGAAMEEALAKPKRRRRKAS